MDKDEIVRTIRFERERTAALLTSLEVPQWDVPTALSGWRVREVVAHLITVDRGSVTGAILPVVTRSVEALERWSDRQVARWADRPVPELILALDRWGRRFQRLVGALPRALYRVPARTLWGRARAGTLVWGRAYDEWVHRQDVRRAVGRPAEDADLAPIVEFLYEVLPSAVLPKVDRREGRLRLDLQGVPAPPWTLDLATGRIDRTGALPPDAGITAEAAPFVLATAGRDRFTDLADRGLLAVEGDRGLAEAFLARLYVA